MNQPTIPYKKATTSYNKLKNKSSQHVPAEEEAESSAGDLAAVSTVSITSRYRGG